jgi:hypothetical protein
VNTYARVVAFGPTVPGQPTKSSYNVVFSNVTGYTLTMTYVEDGN